MKQVTIIIAFGFRQLPFLGSDYGEEHGSSSNDVKSVAFKVNGFTLCMLKISVLVV